SGRALSWLLEETSVLSSFRTDVPRDARQALSSRTEGDDATIERKAVRRLWEACLNAVERTPAPRTIEPPVLRRHRDLLLAATGGDSDTFVHPLLIRFLAGYLDQGLAHWVMPDRDRGIHGCFLELYRTSLTARCGPWARALPRLVAEDRHAARTALA